MSLYYLIFIDTDTWYQQYLRPMFGHVAILKSHSKGFIKIDPRSKFLDIEYWGTTIENIAKAKGIKILRIEVNDGKLKYRSKKLLSFIPLSWGIFNCVMLAKYTLGVYSWSITPYQLYKCLVRGSSGKYDKNKHLTVASIK